MFTWQLGVAGLSLFVVGLIFGAIFAWIARLGQPQIIAISLETCMQNFNITFILLKMTFSSPLSDIAALSPMSHIAITTATLLSIYAIRVVVNCFKKRKTTNDERVNNMLDMIEMEEHKQSLLIVTPNVNGDSVAKIRNDGECV